ncbi:MAG: hypothetical protein N2170_08060 [Bacteroidia bacterium]|nr:hypothetical protein [Bacteroidia bacterium]
MRRWDSLSQRGTVKIPESLRVAEWWRAGHLYRLLPRNVWVAGGRDSLRVDRLTGALLVR